MSTSGAAARRTRRSPDEVRALVLRAAHDLFTSQGYQATRTRQIAERAQVAEPVIFRHFGSKAEIFEISLLTPFTEFANAWAASWEEDPLESADEYEMTRTFVEGFYKLTVEHQEVLRTLMSARAAGGDDALVEVANRVVEQLGALLTLIRSLLEKHAAARGWGTLDSPVTVAVALGSILSVVLFDDWIFPAGQPRPGRAREIEELTQMLLRGVAHRPAPASRSTQRP
ncbi:TetR/AcrR family transcriptional regulator [Nocardioides humilatus]|uniref:TetR/AcrR family transcriptional regulator n=1 Tax=Nocardioides humilatus TaxID=2607660 RepID=A0A5B1LMU0_9ACTN|nr:TetR/AcrR family transcriptional regulator [Nocardioides humilatus]KAA1421863.1 TetR/AcrR family transcriptional regulator [Nocardioides humilatus]